MLKWMCGLTSRDNIRAKLTHERDNKSDASVQETYRKTTGMVRPSDRNDRGAHSENNAR